MVVKRTRERSECSSPASPASASAGGRKKVLKRAEGLEGLKVVITGETALLERSILEGKLRDAGAVITSAVSGVTNILIYGPKLEDGRPAETSTKYKKAEELISSGKSKVGLRLISEADFYREFPIAGPSGAPAPRTGTAHPSNPNTSLWTERWRPVSESDFSCNLSAYTALREWLARWTPQQQQERGCLLTGPPGVGKTSSALAVCRNEGYELVEMNASDTRSKKQLQILQPLIWGGCTLRKGSLNQRICLLMDEADGLSAGDRGGSDELCRMIRSSAIPIVATCNDKQHPKVKTLSKYCRVISFSKPDAAAAVRRCLEIARAEGCPDVSEAAIQKCYTASNGDMRQLVNSVQVLATGQAANHEAITRGAASKDIVTYEDVFAVTRKLVVQASNGSHKDLLRYFFFDYDMVPLIIQENCPKTLLKNKNERVALLQLARMCDSITVGDRIMSRIRERGQWELLPDAGLFGAVIPARCANPQQAFRMDFPGVLGRISARNKRRRQLSELRGLTGHSDGVSDGLFELLGDWLCEPLLVNGDTDDFLARAEAYHLTSKDLTTDSLMNVRHKNSLNPFDAVNAKNKAKLTKAFTARDLITQKKRRGKAAALTPAAPPSSSDDDADQSVEQDVDIVDSPMMY